MKKQEVSKAERVTESLDEAVKRIAKTLREELARYLRECLRLMAQQERLLQIIRQGGPVNAWDLEIVLACARDHAAGGGKE